MAGPGLRGTLVNIVPNWLSNRLGLNVGFRILWVFAYIFDWVIQYFVEGLQASLPGIGTDTALPLIGQSRGLIQGRVETNASFVRRLIAWLATWTKAGSAIGLATQLQIYLGGDTLVRVVDRAGNFVSVGADGIPNFFLDSSWDWDSLSATPGAFGWSDTWIIIYADPPYGTYTSLADTDWIAQWGVGDSFIPIPSAGNPYTPQSALGASNPGDAGFQLGTGHKVPRNERSAILQLIQTWKGAHTYVQAVIWSTDSTLFVPGSLGIPGNPDGTWGQWGYGVSLWAPARTQATAGGTVRYWTPEIGT